jgi:hypothetical protein
MHMLIVRSVVIGYHPAQLVYGGCFAAYRLHTLQNIIAMQQIISMSSLTHRDATAIALHITHEPGACHSCSYPLTGEPTDHCPFCQAVNYDW